MNLVKGDCPHCQKPVEIEFDMPKNEENKAKNITIENKGPQMQTQIIREEHDHNHDTPKDDPHKLLAESLPKGVNFGKCSGENCGKKIKNAQGLVTKFKTCTNCKANTVPKGKKYCPTCGIDEKEDEPFEDSDVELPEDEE